MRTPAWESPPFFPVRLRGCCEGGQCPILMTPPQYLCCRLQRRSSFQRWGCCGVLQHPLVCWPPAPMLVIPMAPAPAPQIEHMNGCSTCTLLPAAVVENLANYVSRLHLPSVTKRTFLVVWILFIGGFSPKDVDFWSIGQKCAHIRRIFCDFSDNALI